jgi:hypothetical protein
MKKITYGLLMSRKFDKDGKKEWHLLKDFGSAPKYLFLLIRLYLLNN